MHQRLVRETFRTSRLLDFCSAKELQAQTGHEMADWPLVIAKEAIDNALDACEDADIAPMVTVHVGADGITITDNGPGIPSTTVESVLDFNVRVSSREAYVSPTRGAQGNAPKTLLAMPFVLSGGNRGTVEISAQGVLHHIDFSVDHIRQQPAIAYRTEPADSKIGTEIKVRWPDSACSILQQSRERFLQIVQDYAWLNPNLTLSVWFGEALKVEATDPAWMKWKASDPTSPHWYPPDRQQRLIAALVAHDADSGRDRTVREFVAQFRGLSGTAKQKAVLEALGLSRAPLSALVCDGAIDSDATAAVFDAMRAQSKPVKPKLLGAIGRDHFEQRCRELGCEMDSFDYRKVQDVDDDGIPYLVETAFAWRGDVVAATAQSDETEEDDPGDPDDPKQDWINRRIRRAEAKKVGRRDIVGVNWSPGITNPFRVLGGYGQSLDSILQRQRVGRDEPVTFVLHVSCPRVDYLDRGKSSVAVRS